jgi:radical SAM superfamily enzyme YgiQ (UPF0313 family)
MKKINLILINLISPEYLVRYQAPLAVTILKKYVESKSQKAKISIIDMQKIFTYFNRMDNLDQENAFSMTVEETIRKAKSICSKGPSIVGFSIKWNTQKIAEKIIIELRKAIKPGQVIFVAGNIGSTFGYESLLKESSFNQSLAVIGEGEDALVSIVNIASEKQDKISNLENYRTIPNVAMIQGQCLQLDSLERVDLKKYPKIILEPEEIYDQEWKVHALETSRGCPWGCCTFCSIGCQFGKTPDGKKGNTEWQAFPVELMMQNIRGLVKKGVRIIDFKDSEFFGPVRKTLENDPFDQTMNRVENFAKSIINLKKMVEKKEPWQEFIINHISARVDTIYRDGESERNKRRIEVYQLLKKAGLAGVYLGIESGSPAQLKRYAKGCTVKENEEALKIFRKLGFEVEAGFIFFDYLASLDELKENIDFIDKTKLFRTDSRLFGSLRVQKGSSYSGIAKKHGLLGNENADSLSFECKYLHKDTEEIEQIFEKWENATRKLVRLVSKSERLKYYKLNYYFLKSIVYAYYYGMNANVPVIASQLSEIRKDFLKKTRSLEINSGDDGKNKKFLEEYITYAERSNQKFKELYKEKIKAKKELTPLFAIIKTSLAEAKVKK